MRITQAWSKRTVIVPGVVTVLALGLAVAVWVKVSTPAPNDLVPLAANSITSPTEEKAPPGLPVRLKIPAINVHAAVEYVGLTAQGEMAPPESPITVGWYEPGPRPGQKGSAVIDGHYGWHDRTPAVFDNLHRLQKGDKLYVEDEKGVVTTFVVRELRTYGQDDDASEVFHSSDDQAHLNLITCHGDWNKSQQSYATRLVVFTDKETEQ